ncbi:glycoside hydrolase family protein [Pseudoalteromonas sp. JBTF-M23]|uniref:Lysozyme n=1 Tax=Pseudoalteromonas caenipelagi TaxID=2726988 RepID=A0A849VBL9_9GAMM|nr:glycoside hydrolase family protein [Pseudoalteromonas caenipelagi]NOU49973.1 glycoside hydrolase family protein [Pseudoalteromonas caenipelagi]
MRIYQLLKRHEGLRLSAYQCSAGKWTIGIGRNLEDNPLSVDEIDALSSMGVKCCEPKAMRLSEESQAYYLLANDIEKINEKLPEMFSNWSEISYTRRDVLRDMAFNLGLSGLANFTKMRAAIEAGNWVDATFEMLNSRWARQVGDCLGQRAYTLAKMMTSDEYPEWTHG